MSLIDGYRAAGERVGRIDRSSRVRLEVRGPDRARFLHNLTTNEVKRLAPGRGCEAFVTSPQGKALAFVTLLVAEDHILLQTEPESLGDLRPHLARVLPQVVHHLLGALRCRARPLVTSRRAHILGLLVCARR